MSLKHGLLGLLVGLCLSIGGVAIAQTTGDDQEEIVSAQEGKVISQEGEVRSDGEISQKGDTIEVGGNVEEVAPDGVIDQDPPYASISSVAPDPVQVAMCKEQLAKAPNDAEACEIVIAQDAGQLEAGEYETEAEFGAAISKSVAVDEAKAAEPQEWETILKESDSK